MKKYITVYQNGKQLLGSDFTRVLVEGLGQKAIDNRLKSFKEYIEGLKKIKPFLNESELTFKIS